MTPFGNSDQAFHSAGARGCLRNTVIIAAAIAVVVTIKV